MDNIRGSVDYSVSSAEWTGRAEPIEYAVLTRWVPSAVRPNRERIHDVTTSLDTSIPYSATHVVVLYKLNNAFAANARQNDEAEFGSRFDLRVTQALPFMPADGISLKDVTVAYERQWIESALEAAGGVQKRAAELLRIKPTTLNEMIKRYDIRPRRRRSEGSRVELEQGERMCCRL